MPTLLMAADPLNGPPQVRLELDWPGVGNVFVQRFDPDGRWSPVRTGEPALVTDGAWIGYDVEAPYGVDVQYRALSDLPDGTELPGTTLPPLVPSSVRLAVDDAWLIHPGIPSLSQRIRIAEVTPVVREVRRGVFHPNGSERAVVVSQVRSAPEYDITLKTLTDQERIGLTLLLASGAPLLLNMPRSKEWGIDTSYVSVGTTREERYNPQNGVLKRRRTVLPLLVVNRPAGDQQQAWTNAGVLAAYATYGAVNAAYASNLDLLADRRR